MEPDRMIFKVIDFKVFSQFIITSQFAYDNNLYMIPISFFL